VLEGLDLLLVLSFHNKRKQLSPRLCALTSSSIRMSSYLGRYILIALAVFVSLLYIIAEDSKGQAEASPLPRIRHANSKRRYFHVPDHRWGNRACGPGEIRGLGGDCYESYGRRRRSVEADPVTSNVAVEWPWKRLTGAKWDILRFDLSPHHKNVNYKQKWQWDCIRVRGSMIWECNKIWNSSFYCDITN